MATPHGYLTQRLPHPRHPSPALTSGDPPLLALAGRGAALRTLDCTGRALPEPEPEPEPYP